jgi:hypothetical protein
LARPSAAEDALLEEVTQRLDLAQEHAAEAYTSAEQHETNPRLGLRAGADTSQSMHPWQDGRFVSDGAASRLLTTVH